jgi:acetate kinase
MTNQSSAKPTHANVLTINGGSSSIKFALFEAGDSLRRILEGGIEMTDRQIAAKIREYLHNWSPDIGWRSNHPTQCGSKILLVISS